MWLRTDQSDCSLSYDITARVFKVELFARGRRMVPLIVDVWSKRRRNEDKECETVSTLDDMDITPGTSTEHNQPTVHVSTEREVGESSGTNSQFGPEKGTGDVLACSNICCSCEGEAYQPKNDVILESLSNKGRRFLPAWYERFPWITICATRKKVFCTFCRQARSLKIALIFQKRR